MANYLYVCENKHARIVLMSVFQTSAIFCDECSLEMWRNPQENGLSFSGLGFYSREK